MANDMSHQPLAGELAFSEQQLLPGRLGVWANRKVRTMVLNSPEVQMLRTYLSVLTSNLSSARERDERGAIAETVIITAILAAAAIAICTIIVIKFTDKANTIPTE